MVRVNLIILDPSGSLSDYRNCNSVAGGEYIIYCLDNLIYYECVSKWASAPVAVGLCL